MYLWVFFPLFLIPCLRKLILDPGQLGLFLSSYSYLLVTACSSVHVICMHNPKTTDDFRLQVTVLDDRAVVRVGHWSDVTVATRGTAPADSPAFPGSFPRVHSAYIYKGNSALARADAIYFHKRERKRRL